MRSKSLLLLMLSCLLLATNQISSQTVGINTEDPNKLTELDVTNLKDNNGDVVPRGIMIPRMSEADRLKIDVTDAGLANSLMIYNTDEDCYNYYSKADKEWKSLCGALGKAVLDPINCSDISVFGTYVEDKEVDANNFLAVNVNITKAGSYAISFKTTNGYSFHLSSVALATGTQTIRIPCQGKPVNVGTDKLTIEGAELVAGCEPSVTVVTSVATYSINCASVVVNGQYVKGTALTSQTITMSVTVSSPGSYTISTPVTSGISFTTSGEFTSAGTFPITLQGSGTPTVNLDFPITINANSPEGNVTCSTTIPVTLPRLTYAILGSGDYSWDYAYRRAALSNGASFGPNGTVRTLGFTQLWNTSSTSTAATNLNNGYGSNREQPDIVLYFAYGAPPTTEVTNALVKYVNNGGVLIYGTSDNTSSAANILLNGIFGQQNAIDRGGSSNQNDYMIENLPNDPIVNGPFGNLSGKFWGEDNSGSVYITSLPPNSVQICSANNRYSNLSVDAGYSVVWYNENKNFVFFGDCVAASASSTSTVGWAAIYTTAGVPKSKPFGYWDSSTAGSVNVFNSALELNSVAWAIKKAAVSGINPH